MVDASEGQKVSHRRDDSERKKVSLKGLNRQSDKVSQKGGLNSQHQKVSHNWDSSQSGKRFHRMGAEQSARPMVSLNTGCTVRVAKVSQERVEQSECQKASHNRVLTVITVLTIRVHKVSHQRGDQHSTRNHPAPETNTPRGHPCLGDQCQRPFISRD